MSITGVVIGVVVVLLSAAWVLYPMLRREQARPTQQQALLKQHERLLVYYEQVLASIRDLDEDLAIGKIAEAEHHHEREQWVQRGMIILSALDELDKRGVMVAENVTDDEDIDHAIEDMISQYAKAASSTQPG